MYMAHGADLTGAFLLPGKGSIQLPVSASSVSNTNFEAFPAVNRVLKVYCTVEWIYAWHTCQERLFLSHETCARNFTTLTTAPITSKSIGQASQTRSSSMSRTTLQYSIFQRICSKSSVCGLLSPQWHLYTI